eukprot:5172670-Pleurochrysis_carterae.AAC.2
MSSSVPEPVPAPVPVSQHEVRACVRARMRVGVCGMRPSGTHTTHKGQATSLRDQRTSYRRRLACCTRARAPVLAAVERRRAASLSK